LPDDVGAAADRDIPSPAATRPATDGDWQRDPGQQSVDRSDASAGHYWPTPFVAGIRRSSYCWGAVVRRSHDDYHRVLEVALEAASVDGPVAFPRPVLDALRRLVPCDVVAYHEPTADGRTRIIWTGEPRGRVTRELRRAQRRYAHEDLLTPANGARKYSDFLGPREFHRLGLYQEVARPLGVEDMFRLWLDPFGDAGARLEFDRAQRDFRERDREVLDALQFLSVREREILELVADGKTNIEIARMLWISPGTVRKHLENAYEKLDVHTRTAAVAALSAETRSQSR
jgi:RNA polymerase sigma factor (sigma-70 family)